MIRLTKNTVCYNPDLKDKLVSIKTFFIDHLDKQFNFNDSNWYLFSNLKEFCEWFNEQEEQKCKNACVEPNKNQLNENYNRTNARKKFHDINIEMIQNEMDNMYSPEISEVDIINTKSRKYILRNVIEYVNRIMAISKLSGKELSYAIADLEEWLQEDLK